MRDEPARPIVYDTWSDERIAKFVESPQLIRIVYSWGGVTSLVMAYESLGRANRNYGRHLVRLDIGLEEPEDLIADIEQAMSNAT
jgi:cystathionine beta-lyase